jgi:hypothetical protein
MDIPGFTDPLASGAGVDKVPSLISAGYTDPAGDDTIAKTGPAATGRDDYTKGELLQQGKQGRVSTNYDSPLRTGVEDDMGRPAATQEGYDAPQRGYTSALKVPNAPVTDVKANLLRQISGPSVGPSHQSTGSRTSGPSNNTD